MEKLESSRRDLLRELKLVKEKLQDVYKTEKFNESTGVGETKHGLALGRLTVKLVEIQNLVDEEVISLGNQSSFKIRINITNCSFT